VIDAVYGWAQRGEMDFKFMLRMYMRINNMHSGDDKRAERSQSLAATLAHVAALVKALSCACAIPLNAFCIRPVISICFDDAPAMQISSSPQTFTLAAQFICPHFFHIMLLFVFVKILPRSL
jgi:hypothetical protein